jgi:hypothetical protein
VTRDDVVNTIMSRLNLTSADARARIEFTVQERYGWLVSSLGLQQSEQTTKQAIAVIGNRELVFDLDKIQRVYDNAVPSSPFILDEVTLLEMRDRVLGTQPAQAYAVLRSGARTTTILLDCVPSSAFVLTADGMGHTITLTADMVPAFPENFHDILIYAGMEVEYRKMEKSDDADKMLALYDRRRSELVFSMAKSSALNIYQAKRGRGMFIPTIPR